MTTKEFAALKGCNRRTVLRAIETGAIPAAAVRRYGQPGRRQAVEIVDVAMAERFWTPSPRFTAARGSVSTLPTAESDYDRDEAAVSQELGELGRDDPAACVGYAKAQLSWNRALEADVTKAKKAGRLNAELESLGRWVLEARRSLVWAVVIARKCMSEIDASHVEGFIDQARGLLLGDPSELFQVLEGPMRKARKAKAPRARKGHSGQL